MPNWISRRLARFYTRSTEQADTTITEDEQHRDTNDGAPANTDADENLNQEMLVFQMIMRRWISELEDSGRAAQAPAAAPAMAQGRSSDTEIPVLNMEDVDQALRDHISQTQRATFWIKLIDLIGVTLFPLLFLRVLRNVFSFISFSDDILLDTDNFVSYIEDNSMDSLLQDRHLTDQDPRTKSLIFKFGQIVHHEVRFYFPNSNSAITRYLTLLSFYFYTSLTSVFMMISFVFLLLCLTYTFGRRWSYIDKFLVNVTCDSNGVF